MAEGDEYVVRLGPNGAVDSVSKNRRSFAYDLDDLDEALAKIRRHEGPGRTVLVVEDDGYRHRVRT